MQRFSFSLLVALVFVPLLLSSCSALREIANLRSVDFAIDRVTEGDLAGIELERIRTYEDLRAEHAIRIGRAMSEGELPLSFKLHLRAENPEENSVRARLVRMDWTLFLEDRETVSGVMNETYFLEPGEPRDIPIDIELDLLQFFERNARDLVDLALAVSGRGGAPKEIRLEARPVIETPIGPIRYPQPITIVSQEVGG